MKYWSDLGKMRVCRGRLVPFVPRCSSDMQLSPVISPLPISSGYVKAGYSPSSQLHRAAGGQYGENPPLLMDT